MEAGPLGYLWSKYECFLMSGCQDMNFEKLAYKTLLQCDGNTDTDPDDRGDCNSSPCTSYRQAKNGHSGSLFGFTKKS